MHSATELSMYDGDDADDDVQSCTDMYMHVLVRVPCIHFHEYDEYLRVCKADALGYGDGRA